jgi:hypothetical protein
LATIVPSRTPCLFNYIHNLTLLFCLSHLVSEPSKYTSGDRHHDQQQSQAYLRPTESRFLQCSNAWHNLELLNVQENKWAGRIICTCYSESAGRGRPRGRSEDSNLYTRAVFSYQLDSPQGAPRRTASCKALSSASVSARFTSFNHPSPLATGQADKLTRSRHGTWVNRQSVVESPLLPDDEILVCLSSLRAMLKEELGGDYPAAANDVAAPSFA